MKTLVSGTGKFEFVYYRQDFRAGMFVCVSRHKSRLGLWFEFLRKWFGRVPVWVVSYGKAIVP